MRIEPPPLDLVLDCWTPPPEDRTLLRRYCAAGVEQLKKENAKERTSDSGVANMLYAAAPQNCIQSLLLWSLVLDWWTSPHVSRTDFDTERVDGSKKSMPKKLTGS